MIDGVSKSSKQERALFLAGLVALCAWLPLSARAGDGEFDCRPTGKRPCIIEVRIEALPAPVYCRAVIDHYKVIASHADNRRVRWQLPDNPPGSTDYKFAVGEAIRLSNKRPFEGGGAEDNLRRRFAWKLKQAETGESTYTVHVVGTIDRWQTQHDCEFEDPIIANN